VFPIFKGIKDIVFPEADLRRYPGNFVIRSSFLGVNVGTKKERLITGCIRESNCSTGNT